MRDASELAAEHRDTTVQRGRVEELYARSAPAGMRLAYLLTGSREQAEDLVQEAFARCVGRFRHMRVPDAFDAYLRRTIVNLHTSALRRRRLERAWLQREAADARRPASFTQVDTAVDLWAALDGLPGRQRSALVLRYYEDLSERETAETLGCSVAAVKSLVARGLEALRAATGLRDGEVSSDEAWREKP
jgi:RNA polymerase sigma-70 factor (sigma-E family)